MSDKTLTARVKIITSQAEKSLDNLNKRISRINNAINKSTASGLTRELNKAGMQASTLQKKMESVNRATSKLGSSANRIGTALKNVTSKMRQWFKGQKDVENSAKRTNAQYAKSNSLVSSLTRTLRGLAATYLGIMGMRTALDTADTITSAENKLNYVGGNDAKFTTESMNQMYASAQKVRMAYTDMMSNVSKSMVLAGDAFQNNIDYATRFQEVMAEAYAVGGASAAEMSSSMYQLIQALGSGTLAGDELRSVREGAPLAYKAIEEFAQGVYDTESSLKDLASQGAITSEIVVAAILNAGDKMDSAFAQTYQTFAQTWTQIKNVAVKAFEPTVKLLRSGLNSLLDNGLISKFESAFSTISKVLQITFKLIGRLFSWVADNWSWLQDVLVAGLLTIGALMLKTALVSIVSWLWVHKYFIGIFIVICYIVQALRLWANGTITTTELIIRCLALIGVALIIVAIMTHMWWLWWIVLGLAVLAFVLLFFEQICAWTWVALTLIGNGLQTLGNFIITILLLILAWVVNCIRWVLNAIIGAFQFVYACFYNAFLFIINGLQWVANAILTVVLSIGAAILNTIFRIVNTFLGLLITIYQGGLWLLTAMKNIGGGLSNGFSTICANIGTYFHNLWCDAVASFWSFIGSVLSGLKFLESPLNAIAKLFGKGSISISATASNAYANASSWRGKKKATPNLYNAFTSGMGNTPLPTVGNYLFGDKRVIELIDYKKVEDFGMSAFGTAFDNVNWQSPTDAWNKGYNTFQYGDYGDVIDKYSHTFGTGLSDYNWLDAYKQGFDFGAGTKDWLNSKGDILKGWLGKKISNITNLDKIGESLGLDFSNDYLNNLTNPSGTDNLGGVKDLSKLPSLDASGVGDVLDKLKDIDDKTGAIKDSVDLTEDDLEYLRKIAAMEWKKEFTTAEIKVDMTNNNSINGDGDLDGIVTKLTDRLYEELQAVADGVYV